MGNLYEKLAARSLEEGAVYLPDTNCWLHGLPERRGSDNERLRVEFKSKAGMCPGGFFNTGHVIPEGIESIVYKYKGRGGVAPGDRIQSIRTGIE